MFEDNNNARENLQGGGGYNYYNVDLEIYLSVNISMSFI